MSAASRPVAMRTSVCRGASKVPSTTRHWPLDERLGDRVEVHRIQTRRVYRNHAGRHLDRPQQRYHQVREVTAYPGAGEQGLHRPVDRVTRARHVVQPGAHPEGDSLQQSSSNQA